MGLRSLLGLPPKTSSAAKPQDPKAFQTALKQCQALVGDPRYAQLPEGLKIELTDAHKDAAALAQAEAYEDAARRLSDTVARAASAIVKVQTSGSDFERVSSLVSGKMDGAAVCGTPADHVQKYRAAYNKIMAAVDNNPKAATSAMEKLLAALDGDKVIKAAKAARDRILDERSDLDKAAKAALALETETPKVMKANRILESRLPMIGFLSGKLDYLGAVKYLDECKDLVAQIESERAAVQSAIALRDQVLAWRRDKDDLISSARLMFGHDGASNALVASFQSVDKDFEGALQARDYRIAASMKSTLERRAQQVKQFEPLVEEALKLGAKASDAISKFRKDRDEISGTPKVTAELKQLLKGAEEVADAFGDAYEDDKLEEMLRLGAEYSDVCDKIKTARDNAAAELQKHTETKNLLDTKLKKKYTDAMKVSALLPELKKAQDDARVQRAEIDAKLRAKEYSEALAMAEALDATLTKIDGLMQANAVARVRKSEVRAAFKKHEKSLRLPLKKVRAYSPEMFALFDTYVTEFDELQRQISKGEDTADALLKKLLKDAKTILDGRAENRTHKKEARKQAEAAMLAGEAGFVAARTLIRKHLPEGQALLDELMAKGKLISGASKNEHFQKVIAVSKEIEALTKTIEASCAQWTSREAEQKSDYEQKLSALGPRYDVVHAFEPISDEIKDLDETATDKLAEAKAAATGKDWLGATEKLGDVEKAVQSLEGLKATHDRLKADRDWVDAKSASIGADVDAAIDDFALLPESIDIQERLIFRKAAADDCYAAKDFTQARAHWERIDSLLSDWNDKSDENDDAWTEKDVQETMRRLKAAKPDRVTASEINPITPEIKKDHDAYHAVAGRLWAAYGVCNWALCLEILDAWEPALQKLIAHKAAYDAALVVATQTSSDAFAEIDGKDHDELVAAPMSEKLALLDGLRAKGAKLTGAERKLQRKLYNAMDYDPEFKEKDERQRAELVEVLKADDEVIGARKGWAGLDNDQRLAVLMKVLNAECKVYNIPAPSVRLFCEVPGDEGFFSDSTVTLNLNTHPMSGWADFKEAVDTVVHENMHNYQRVLIERLAEGVIVEGDPEYMQACIFAANDAPYGYVKPSEKPDDDEADDKPYMTQPVEAHAWDTGDGVAKELLKAPEPPRNVNL